MNDQEIQAAFLEHLATDRRNIESAWSSWRTSKGSDKIQTTALVRAVHSLAGAALTVGYSRIGNAARRLENYLNQNDFPDHFAAEKLVTTLFTEIEARVYDGVVENKKQVVHSIKSLPSLQETRSSSLIYLVDDDPTLIETLVSQMSHFGYSVRAFATLRELSNAAHDLRPTAILMDVVFPEGELAGIEAIRALQDEYNNQVPVFFLSVREDVTARLQSIRAGGKQYFTKPVDIGALVDALDRVIVTEEPEQARVLILDDSEVQAKVNAMHLAKAGIDSRIITNPFDILGVLDEFLPDLLLLDLYMPECTGLELAQVIRQIKTYVSLPIVYLSSETDRDMQLTAVGFGGDDFLTKPIKPEHLIAAVMSRVERYRELRALMSRDSLTGLLNHTSFRERLGQEAARSARNNQPLALAMIDIDHFKKVNDTYGHPTGDRVLKALTHVLTRRLRQNDVIGRYGGEEFVVALPGTNAQTALQVLNELRDAFSQVRHTANGIEFKVTFSCGVAAFPEHQTPAALSEAADRALYAAKREGRNRVMLAK